MIGVEEGDEDIMMSYEIMDEEIVDEHIFEEDEQACGRFSENDEIELSVDEDQDETGNGFEDLLITET